MSSQYQTLGAEMSSRLKRILPSAAVVALSFVLALVELDNGDIWWHLKCGEMLLTQGLIPRAEIFSYTAQGAPWVDGYLIAQAVFYMVWRIGGSAGIVLLGALLVAASYALALFIGQYGAPRTSDGCSVPSQRDSDTDKRICPCRHGYAVTIGASIPAVFLTYGTMIVRPALLTPIFALLTLWLLEDHRLNNRNRIFWLILLSAVWANCHPAFFLGPIFTAFYILGALRNGPLRKKLALVFAGQIIAAFINPYGYRIYYSVFSFVSDPRVKESINEWKSLFAEPPVLGGVVPCFILVVVLWLVCLGWSRLRTRPEHALSFFFIVVSAISGRRNLLLFGVLSLPLISWTVSDAGTRGWLPLNEKYRAVTAWLGNALIIIISTFLIWLAATNRLIFYTSTLRSTGLGVQAAMFPEEAVDLLGSEHIEGNLFTTYNNGGYIIFKLYPKYLVFFDGRYYPYPYDVFQLGMEALSSPDAFETVRSRYNVRAVLMSLYLPNTWPILNGLLHSPDWAVVQADGSGVLFLRRGAGNDPIIQRHEMNLLKDPPPLVSPPGGINSGTQSLFQKIRLCPRILNKTEYPYGPMRWGRFYEKIGRPDLAARSVEPALACRQEIKNLKSWLGRLLIESGNFDKGIGYVRDELAKDPNNVPALWAMATYHLMKGEYYLAEDILRQIEKLDKEMGLEAYRQALDMMKARGAPAENIRRVQDRINTLGWGKR